MFAVSRTLSMIRNRTAAAPTFHAALLPLAASVSCASSHAAVAFPAACASNGARGYRTASSKTKKKKLVKVATPARAKAKPAAKHGATQAESEWTSFLGAGHAVPTKAAAVDTAVVSEAAPQYAAAAWQASHGQEAQGGGYAASAHGGGRMKLKELRGMVASSVVRGAAPKKRPRLPIPDEAPEDPAPDVAAALEEQHHAAPTYHPAHVAAPILTKSERKSASRNARRAAKRAEELAAAAAAGGTEFPSPPKGFRFTLEQVETAADEIVRQAAPPQLERDAFSESTRRRRRDAGGVAVNGFTLYARETGTALADAARRWRDLSDAERANYTQRATARAAEERSAAAGVSARPCCVSSFGVFIKLFRGDLPSGAPVWASLGAADKKYLSEVAAAIRVRVAAQTSEVHDESAVEGLEEGDEV